MPDIVSIAVMRNILLCHRYGNHCAKSPCTMRNPLLYCVSGNLQEVWGNKTLSF